MTLPPVATERTSAAAVDAGRRRSTWPRRRVGRSPRRAAEQLTHAEHVVRDPAASEARAAARLSSSRSPRELALHPSWLDPVLDRLPEPLRDDALDQVAARHEFLDMASEASLADGPPTAGGSSRQHRPTTCWPGTRRRREYGIDWGAARRHQPRRDRPRTNPRRLGRGRPGPDAVHAGDLGEVGTR